MTNYLVTYDLKKSYYDDRSSDYDKLYKKLESYYSKVKLTESSWIVSTYKSNTELRDDIMSVLKSNDALFVGKLSGLAAWNSCIDSDYKIKAILNS